MDDFYTPVACGIYDTYEVACMRGVRQRFETRGGEVIGVPVSLSIWDAAEVLTVRQDDGSETRLRLDRIHKMLSLE